MAGKSENALPCSTLKFCHSLFVYQSTFFLLDILLCSVLQPQEAKCWHILAIKERKYTIIKLISILHTISNSYKNQKSQNFLFTVTTLPEVMLGADTNSWLQATVKFMGFL